MNAHSLTLHWSTSRGENTYGYTIARLTDENGHHYRTCGGGYDMTGTVFGEWLATRYQPELRAISARSGSWYSKAAGYKSARRPFSPPTDTGPIIPDALYDMTRNDDTGAIVLGGACGLECMIDIARAIGLSVKRTENRKGHTTGFLVVPTL